MKYGQIAGNKSINATIYRCFEHICEEDARKFVRKFNDQRHDGVQVMHTFRELILGAYLALSGLNVRYDYVVGTETPDWCVLDETSAPKIIVELTNFHIDKATEDAIEAKRQAGGMWVGWIGRNDDRLYNSIWHKASIYKTLVEECGISYSIAVFGEFPAAVDIDELHRCLFDRESGLFELYPVVSGVLFFEEISGQYQFSYMPNPEPLKALSLPNGVF